MALTDTSLFSRSPGYLRLVITRSRASEDLETGEAEPERDSIAGRQSVLACHNVAWEIVTM